MPERKDSRARDLIFLFLSAFIDLFLFSADILDLTQMHKFYFGYCDSFYGHLTIYNSFEEYVVSVIGESIVTESYFKETVETTVWCQLDYLRISHVASCRGGPGRIRRFFIYKCFSARKLLPSDKEIYKNHYFEVRNLLEWGGETHQWVVQP